MPSASGSVDALGALAELSLPTPHRQAGWRWFPQGCRRRRATHGAPQPEEPSRAQHQTARRPLAAPGRGSAGTCTSRGAGAGPPGLGAPSSSPRRATTSTSRGPTSEGCPGWANQKVAAGLSPCGRTPWPLPLGLSRAIRKCTGGLPSASLPPAGAPTAWRITYRLENRRPATRVLPPGP